MCTIFALLFFDLYGAFAYIFNSHRICAQVALVNLTHKKVLGVRSIRENNLLMSVLMAHERAFLEILIYKEVSDGV